MCREAHIDLPYTRLVPHPYSVCNVAHTYNRVFWTRARRLDENYLLLTSIQYLIVHVRYWISLWLYVLILTRSLERLQGCPIYSYINHTYIWGLCTPMLEYYRRGPRGGRNWRGGWLRRSFKSLNPLKLTNSTL